MSWFADTEDVPVELEECRCPGTPHDHDTVWLAAELSPEAGIAALSVLAGDNATLAERLGRSYIETGITRWTFVDGAGLPVPVDKALIRRFKWDAAFPIANKAAELYGEAFTRPLVGTASKSSSNGHTAQSTSRRTRSSPVRPKP